AAQGGAGGANAAGSGSPDQRIGKGRGYANRQESQSAGRRGAHARQADRTGGRRAQCGAADPQGPDRSQGQADQASRAVSRALMTGFAKPVNALSAEELEAEFFDWARWALPKQLPPPGDWTTWLLLGGRGSGKTRAGAEWVRRLARERVSPIALVGETMTEALDIMVRGQSGIMAVHPDHERPILKGRNRLVWPNGSEAAILTASDPERFRGPQFAAAWCDEIGKWPRGEDAWDMLQFGLRLGERPRQMATTTPRATRLIRLLLADEHAAVVRMSTEENRAQLAPNFLEAVVARYRGTVLGRQELDGELIED